MLTSYKFFPRTNEASNFTFFITFTCEYNYYNLLLIQFRPKLTISIESLKYLLACFVMCASRTQSEDTKIVQISTVYFLLIYRQIHFVIILSCMARWLSGKRVASGSVGRRLKSRR